MINSCDVVSSDINLDSVGTLGSMQNLPKSSSDNIFPLSHTFLDHLLLLIVPAGCNNFSVHY